MKKYLILPLVALITFACNERVVGVYDSPNYVILTKGLMDTTRLSFFFFPLTPDVVEYPIEVNLAGRSLEKDTPYKVVINSQVTDAPSNIYELPETFIFRKGMVKDTFNLRLINHPDLKTKEYIISFEIADMDGMLSPGQLNGCNVLFITDKALRPNWWTTSEEVLLGSFENTYLGKYSDKKYSLFMKVTGIIDMGVLPADEKRTHSIIFKRYLKKNPTYEDDGNLMVVTVAGE